MEPETQRIRPAATVVVVRDGDPELEVFLVKRHRKSKFMGAFYVFPGGRVDRGDAAFVEMNAASVVDTVWAPQQVVVDPFAASAFAFAAIRETAEESGILLAAGEDGTVADHDTAESVFDALKTGAPFVSLLQQAALQPMFEAIYPLTWWITPPFERYRYNTRFFLTQMPGGQRASYDEIETTDGVWMTAAQALDAFHQEDLALAPPTYCTLELVKGATSLNQVLGRAHRPIRPNLPELIEEAGEKVLVIPGDPAHSASGYPAPNHRTRFRVLGPGQFR